MPVDYYLALHGFLSVLPAIIQFVIPVVNDRNIGADVQKLRSGAFHVVLTIHVPNPDVLNRYSVHCLSPCGLRPWRGPENKKALVGTSAQPGFGSNQRSFLPGGCRVKSYIYDFFIYVDNQPWQLMRLFSIE
jgi:hypothetical protein